MGFRIGTRGSRLALAQAEEVARLLRARGMPTELVPITTSGDRGATADASPAGVKGLFVAEIVRALQDGDVDLAVHSAKDLPSEDPEGVVVAAVPGRGPAHDLLVTREPDLPDGGSVGTSSLRRMAQLRRWRPGLDVREIRGNVDTRLRKMQEGAFDALVLAAAGLARLGIQPPHAEAIPVEVMVPAPGQGALAVQARPGDPAEEAAGAIDDPGARRAFTAERRVVSALGGGCRLPLGAHATVGDGVVRVTAVVLPPDGSLLLRAEAEASEPLDAGDRAAATLRAAGAEDILRAASS